MSEAVQLPRVGRTKAEALAGDQPPETAPVNVAAIPAALRERRQWVSWRWERPADKWTKVLINAATGKRAKINDASTWASFAEAEAHSRAAGLPGVGFVFSPDDGLCGVDLDDAIDPATGALKPWAAAVVAELGTYTEVSPTGTGVKLFLSAAKPAGRCSTPLGDGKAEMYDRGRFFCVTGQIWRGSPATPQPRQAEADAFYARDFRPARTPTPIQTNGNGLHPLRATNGASVIDRAVAYLAKCPPAVSGQSGHDQTFAVARAVVYGFDLGPEQGFTLLWTHYNPHCLPPWTEAELRHKCRDADAQAFDKPRGWLLNGKPPAETRAADRRTGDPPPPVAPPTQPDDKRDGKTIILAYFRKKYDPTFRRGTAFYSNRLGREVKVSTACFAPNSELVEQLAKATDAPTYKGQLQTDQLPKFFQTWAKVAAVDLLDSLPEEDDGAELAEGAAEEFRAKVAEAMHTIVAVGYAHKKGKEGSKEETSEIEVQRRSIVEWCSIWVKTGKWASIRSYQAWTKRDDGDSRLRIAIRPELFGQLGRGTALGQMGQNRFGRLCERYGVGVVPEQKVAGARCVELTAEFIESLLTKPPEPAELPEQGPRACAHASENGKSATPGEKGGESA